MSENTVLRAIGLKPNVEVLEGDCLPGANFSRGILTVLKKGFAEEQLHEAVHQISFSTDVKAVEMILPRDPPGFGFFRLFGMLGGAVSGALAADVSGGPRKKDARIDLVSGATFRVRADPVRIDMMLKQWKDLRGGKPS